MEWNDGKERALFEREQARLREEYLAAGMTEEQIQAMREYDMAWYRNRRREARHTQRLDITAFDEDNAEYEAKNPLLKKFLHNFSTEDKHWESERLGWIEEIEDEELYTYITNLSAQDKEVLTLYLYDGYSQQEIADKIGISQQAISKKILKMKKIFEKRL